jgi:hypothetical protein
MSSRDLLKHLVLWGLRFFIIHPCERSIAALIAGRSQPVIWNPDGSIVIFWLVGQWFCFQIFFLLRDTACVRDTSGLKLISHKLNTTSQRFLFFHFTFTNVISGYARVYLN